MDDFDKIAHFFQDVRWFVRTIDQQVGGIEIQPEIVFVDVIEDAFQRGDVLHACFEEKILPVGFGKTDK